MRRAVSILVLLALAGAIAVTATASKGATPKTTGTVVGVSTGDTLKVRLKNGKLATVRILGVHAPSGSDCYARESAAEASALALRQRVTLLGDLKRAVYVSLPSGEDLGRLLLGRGAVQIDVWGSPFARLADYVPVQEGTEKAARGMWGACAADIGVTVTGPDRASPGDYVTYTATVTNAGPLTAQHVQVELRPGSYAKTITSVNSSSGACASKGWVAYCTIDGLSPGGTATVTLVIRPTQAGALTARAVATIVGCTSAQCGGAALQDRNLDNDRAATSTIVPGGAYGLPGHECDPSYPTVCIPPPPPDLDCADFAPLKAFPVRRDVADPDPHHLDGNNDGIACQGDDY